MRIKVTEKVLRDTNADTGQQYDLREGDEVTVPDPYGKRLCDRGWVKDADGTYPSAERVPGAVRVAPRRVKVPQVKKGN